MDESPESYRAGVEQAKHDALAGVLRYFSGAPSRTAWGRDLVETLAKSFGIEVVLVGDITTAAKRAFEHGYNAALTEYVDSRFGSGAMRTALNGVQERRKAAYDRYFTAENAGPQ